MTEKTVTIELRQQRDYQFEIDFGDGVPTLLGDEPPPLGAGRGPSPVQLLCAAVGNCLSDSLLFAFRKYKQQPEPLACEVQAQIGRNEQGRLRVLSMTARLALGVPAAGLEHLDRVLDQFEGFCTVTQSVAQGVNVKVEVRDAYGLLLR